MEILSDLSATIAANWPIWFVTITLIVAAVIDGFQLKVPNWITFPMVIGGWMYSACTAGVEGYALAEYTWYEGLGWSLLGTAVGLAVLLPAYAIGGMGAGDVKLMAGVGAWVHATVTFYAFCISTIIGGVLAVIMILAQRAWKKHSHQFAHIVGEIFTIRNPNQLSQIAAERKSSMLLLPYGIPLALGTIGYFIFTGMLV